MYMFECSCICINIEIWLTFIYKYISVKKKLSSIIILLFYQLTQCFMRYAIISMIADDYISIYTRLIGLMEGLWQVEINKLDQEFFFFMKMHLFKLENPQWFFSSEYNEKWQLEKQKFTCKNGLLEMEPKAINLKID